MKKVNLRLDNVSYQAELPEELASNFLEAIEKLQGQVKDASERADSVHGELDALKSEKAELEKKLAKAEDPDTINKAVEARVRLVQDCKKLYPEIDTKGKKEREIKIEALTNIGFDEARFDGKSDAYVDGVFETKLESAPNASNQDDVRSVGVSPEPRQDSNDNNFRSADVAYKEMVQRSRDAWKPKDTIN